MTLRPSIAAKTLCITLTGLLLGSGAQGAERRIEFENGDVYVGGVRRWRTNRPGHLYLGQRQSLRRRVPGEQEARVGSLHLAGRAALRGTVCKRHQARQGPCSSGLTAGATRDSSRAAGARARDRSCGPTVTATTGSSPTTACTALACWTCMTQPLRRAVRERQDARCRRLHLAGRPALRRRVRRRQQVGSRHAHLGPTENLYRGEFEGDERTGLGGTLFWRDGTVFHGQFAAGRCRAYGVKRTPDGSMGTAAVGRGTTCCGLRRWPRMRAAGSRFSTDRGCSAAILHQRAGAHGRGLAVSRDGDYIVVNGHFVLGRLVQGQPEPLKLADS